MKLEEEMAASIDNYEPTYQQAMTAYVQRNYEVAATLVDQVVQNLPNDPNTHLLRVTSTMFCNSTMSQKKNINRY